MLNLNELVALERSLRGELVLTVYLAGVGGNPAAGRTWRAELTRILSEVRRASQGASHGEREALAASCAHASGALERIEIAAMGWAAFILPDGVRYAEALAMAMPTLAVWQRGAVIAPYLRLMSQQELAFAVIIDRRSARILRHVGGEITTLDTLRPQLHHDRFSRARGSPSGTFHQAVRGSTGRDEQDRQRVAQREALNRALAERLQTLVGEERPIVFGGTPSAVQMAVDALPPRLREHTVVDASLGESATPREISQAVQRAVQQLEAQRALALVNEIGEQAGASGLGATGVSATLSALREGRARELLMSRRWIEDQLIAAESAIRLAIDQEVPFAEYNGEVAARLDALGGVAGRLRYVARPVTAGDNA